MRRLALLALLAGSVLVSALGTAPVTANTITTTADPALETTIRFLVEAVAEADVAFIRNGRTYTSDEAVEHMLRKYEHFRDRIETPEDFIRLAATRSLMSGKPYRVKLADGSVLESAEWLHDVLKRYRTETAPASGAAAGAVGGVQ